jgi:hypothetical protein
MGVNAMKSSFDGRALCVLAAALLAAGPGAAWAVDIQVGPVTGSLDNTISVGTSIRVSERDRALVGRSQGGTGYSVNGDDGNLNYDTGVFGNAGKVTHDLQLRWLDYGAFVRGSYFYDIENMDGDRERTPLTDKAKSLVGRDARLLDAYLRAGFRPRGLPMDLRAGWQVLNWGESTFLTNGIGVANPVDVSKLRVPGSELREAFLGIPMARASATVAQGLSLEGFYSFRWDRTDIDPAGTYFSTNDFAGDGGQFVVLGFGAVPDAGLPIPGSRQWTHVPRAKDREARGEDQFGLATRWLSPLLGTEFGFYHLTVHSKLPIISALAASRFAPNPLQGNQVQPVPGSGAYFVEYPEHIRVFGGSFNTALPWGGMALQGEYSNHHDEPLQVDDVEILLAALAPAPVPPVAYASQLPQPGLGREVSGYILRNVSQAQMTVTKAMGATLAASEWILLGEAGFTQVHRMPDESELRLEGPGTPLPGNPLVAAGSGVPVQEEGFATAFSWGYRLVTRLDFESVIGALGLSPRLAFSHDVDGVSPVPAGNFVEKRKAITLGITANYLARWAADLSWTDFFGDAHDQIRDRDFVSASLKYAF